MDLRQLEALVAVAEEGSFGAAAARLHLTQPPLSARIKALEEELGTPLIERGPRRSTPTEAGRLLAERARRLLLLADAAKEEVAQLGEGVRGVLRLGLISSGGPTLFTPALAGFCRRYPELQIELQEGNSYELIELLRTGAIEAAVLRTPFSDEGLSLLALHTEPMAALAPAALFEGLPDGPLHPADLSGRPVAYYRRFDGLLHETFRRAGARLWGRFVVDDARTALAFASIGAAIALAPVSAGRMAGELTVRPLAAEELVTTVTLAFRAGGPTSAGGRALREFFAPR